MLSWKSNIVEARPIGNQFHRLIVFMIAIVFTTVVVNGQSAFAQTVRISVDRSDAPGGTDDDPDVIIWDLDGGNVTRVSASRLVLLGESTLPGVNEALVDMGDSYEFGLLWEVEEVVKDGNAVTAPSTIRLMIVF